MSKETDNIIPDSTLFIDVGNSSIKTAVQTGFEWKEVNRFGLNYVDELVDSINSSASAFKVIVISSVVEKVTDTLTEKVRNVQCRVLNIQDIPDDLLDYDTPDTLGIDRFFACYGAIFHTNNATVVIDAGSACTIDYMSADGIYRGGVIMPGILSLERALKIYTPSLPEVPRQLPHDWPGRSTRAGLQWGITGLYTDGIQASLKRYEQQFGSFELVLTGGDAEWLASVLQQETKIRPMLVFEGMKRFLQDFL